MRIRLLAAILAAAITVVCLAQQSADETGPRRRSPDAGQAPQASPGVILLPHMSIDPANRQIVLQSEVCLRGGMLELLVCRAGTKEHESILTTGARPSDVHAALLVMGLRPGMPARWFQFGDEPARAIPPRGAAMAIRLRWRDPEGLAHDVAAGSWLRRVGAEETQTPEEWIFVGSDLLADDTYWADSSGEIVSVSNFSASVIDVPFASSSANADLLFVAETEAIPPLGTAVEIVIAPSPDPADSARAWVSVDRFGQFTVDDRSVSPDELERWAQAFALAYPKGQVIVRGDSRAMGAAVEAATFAVRMGGVWDIVETRISLAEPVLPRTAGQAETALRELWVDLSESGIYGDPRADAAATLARIERETVELKRLEALWSEYAAHIRQALEEHPPVPASDDVEASE